MREKTNARKGFSLIELLVVIAIIAILAAILFPVFNSVRENTRRTTCMTQMHSIGQAVSIYYTDNQKYPDVLCALVPYNTGIGSNQKPYDGAGGHTPLPIAQALAQPLIKMRASVTGKETFLCPDSQTKDPTAAAITTAVYPANIPLSGQVKDPATGFPLYYYTYDSYDVGPALDATGLPVSPTTYELHYSKDWTKQSGKNDPINQLKYPNPPPSSTVITWCTYHCAVAHSGQIPVLMLSGNVKSYPANQFLQKGPLQFSP